MSLRLTRFAAPIPGILKCFAIRSMISVDTIVKIKINDCNHRKHLKVAEGVRCDEFPFCGQLRDSDDIGDR